MVGEYVDGWGPHPGPCVYDKKDHRLCYHQGSGWRAKVIEVDNDTVTVKGPVRGTVRVDISTLYPGSAKTPYGVLTKSRRSAVRNPKQKKLVVLVTRLHENKPAEVYYEGPEELALEVWRTADRAAEMNDEIAVILRGSLDGPIVKMSGGPDPQDMLR